MAVTINGTTGIVTPDIGVDGSTLVIDSVNNRVGVQEDSPSNTLTVGDTVQPSYAPTRAGNYIEIARTSGADAGLLINKNTGQWLVGINNGDGANAPLRFEYAAAGSSHPGLGAGTLGMIIKHDGKVGINKSSPSSFLHVAGGDYQTLRLENTDNGANGPYIELYNNSNSPADNDYIGIISFKNRNSNNEEITYSQIRSQSVDVTDGAEDGNITFHTRLNGTFGERLRIIENGMLGIGHHSAAQITKELTIRPVDDGGIMIGRPGDTVTPINAHLLLTTTTSGSVFPAGEAYTVKYNTRNCDSIFTTFEGGGTGGNISFQTGVGNGNAVERLRLRSDGKISAGSNINVTNTYEFSVTGADGTGGFYAHGRNHYLSNRSTAYASLTLKKSNADSDNIDYLQLRDSANAYLSGFSGAGNLKPAAGKGIDFSNDSHSGGMTSELLDDYEEGTWTPTIRENGTGTEWNTISNQNGTYTKVGRLVTITFRFDYSARASNVNQGFYAWIAGLPFQNTTSGVNEGAGTLMIARSGGSTTPYHIYLISSQGNTLGVYGNQDSTTPGPMMTSEWPNVAAQVRGQYMYYV